MSDDVKIATKPETKPGSVLAPRDPFGAFRAEMDRLMETFFGAGRANLPALDPGSWFGAAPAPAVDLKEADGTLTLTAELPGMAPENVEIALEGRVLTLKGEKKEESEKAEGETRVSERRWGAFERRVALPAGVDAAQAKATFDKGVLTVTLPKRKDDPDTPRRIAIG
jgi:HSP20 family protein